MLHYFRHVVIFTFIAIVCLPGCTHHKKTPKREREKERKAAQRPFKNKKIDRLAFDEARKVYDYYKRTGQSPQLAQTIERIITLSSDHEIIEPLLHELADLTFEAGNYTKAQEHYAQHALLYPGSSSIDYIKSQQIEAAFKQMLSPNHDQSKTKEIIQLCDSFLTSFPANNRFTKHIVNIRQDCYVNLTESELDQIAFYLQRFALTENKTALEAAWQRLIHLNQAILPHLIDPRIKAAHQKITEAQTAEETQRNRATIEQLITPLQTAIHKHVRADAPTQKSLWRSRF